MAIGDVRPVTAGQCGDLWYVDTGMYDTAEYGSVYILDADRPAVVDAGIGTDVDRIVAALEQVGIGREDLEHIALTHVHLDHAGGAGLLAETYPNATVVCHDRGVDHMVDPARLVEGTKRAVGDQWEFYAEPTPVPESRIRAVSDGDAVDLGDRRLQVHHAPGHAPHQVVFADHTDSVVFTGDAAGIYVPSRDSVRHTTPPPNFDLERALTDVSMLASLEPAVLCYGHFGATETGTRLQSYANVLTEWVDRVADRRADTPDQAVADYFAERTPMDEVWGARKARAEERMNVRGVCRYLDLRDDSDV